MCIIGRYEKIYLHIEMVYLIGTSNFYIHKMLFLVQSISVGIPNFYLLCIISRYLIAYVHTVYLFKIQIL